MNRLKQLREEHHKTMAQVAREINMPYTTYVNYEKGTREPNSEILIAFAKYFSCSVDYLIGGCDNKTERKLIEINSDFHNIKPPVVPVLGKVVAGYPTEAVENILDYEEISEQMASSGEYFGLQVKGDSMQPRFNEGDVVIVRKQEDINSGEIAIILVNGDEATIKKVQKFEGGINLIPSNPIYDVITYTNEQILNLPVRCLGKVVELRAKF